jgi:hypothetical protein
MEILDDIKLPEIQNNIPPFCYCYKHLMFLYKINPKFDSFQRTHGEKQLMNCQLLSLGITLYNDHFFHST